MKCERSEGVGEAERRERDQSGWERPSVAMETGSYQLTPCFPLVPPDSPPSLFIFPSLAPLTLFFSFLSLSPSRPRPLSPLSSPPPLPPAPPALYIHHTLVSSHLTLSSLTGFISTHSLSPSFSSGGFFLLFFFFTVAQIKPTTLHRIPRRRG